MSNNPLICARATSFATRQDLARFARAVSCGIDWQKAIAKGIGDNGVGDWNDDTWNPDGIPICALPRSAGQNLHNRKVEVTLSIGHGNPFECAVRGIAPAEGVIDLNPAALRAAGLPVDYELDDGDAKWRFVGSMPPWAMSLK